MAKNVGQMVRLATSITDLSDVLTDATVTLTVTDPAGAVTTPTVAHGTTGQYSATFTLTSAGIWHYVWAASGAVVANDSGQIDVEAIPRALIVSLQQFKKQLGRDDPTDTDDDEELTEWLVASTECVEELIEGPITPTVFTEFSTTGRSGMISLDRRPLISVASITPDRPGASALSSSLYSVNTDDGVIYWRGAYGYRVVTVYTAGLTVIPRRYRRAGSIIAQHLWMVENGGGPAPSPGELTLVPGAGFAIPNRAVELLSPTIFGGFA